MCLIWKKKKIWTSSFCFFILPGFCCNRKDSFCLNRKRVFLFGLERYIDITHIIYSDFIIFERRQLCITEFHSIAIATTGIVYFFFFTFRRNFDILSPCSQGVTQPLLVLQSSRRVTFVDELLPGMLGRFELLRSIFFFKNLLKASTNTNTASYINAACACFHREMDQITTTVHSSKCNILLFHNTLMNTEIEFCPAPGKATGSCRRHSSRNSLTSRRFPSTIRYPVMLMTPYSMTSLSQQLSIILKKKQKRTSIIFFEKVQFF